MLNELKARGLKNLNVALRCGTPNAIKAAVKNKMGIGILFSDTLQEELARKEFKVLKFSGVPELLGHSYILFNKKKPLSLPLTTFSRCCVLVKVSPRTMRMEVNSRHDFVLMGSINKSITAQIVGVVVRGGPTWTRTRSE